jgi:hypothetical protein
LLIILAGVKLAFIDAKRIASKNERQIMHALLFSPMLASMLLAHSAAVFIVVLTVLAIIRTR